MILDELSVFNRFLSWRTRKESGLVNALKESNGFSKEGASACSPRGWTIFHSLTGRSWTDLPGMNCPQN